MKIPVLAGSLLLLLNFSVASHAQEEKRDEAARPSQQENRPADVKPPDTAPAQEEPNKTTREEPKNTDKQGKQENKQQNDEMQRGNKEQGREQVDQKDQKGQNRASASGSERDHRQTERIPDDKFRAHFGREHHFRVSQPVIVENRSRFQYSGYWFEFIDVWPADWSYSDDCYVDYIDGQYFLFNVLHPGIRVALVVVL